MLFKVSRQGGYDSYLKAKWVSCIRDTQTTGYSLVIQLDDNKSEIINLDDPSIISFSVYTEDMGDAPNTASV